MHRSLSIHLPTQLGMIQGKDRCKYVHSTTHTHAWNIPAQCMTILLDKIHFAEPYFSPSGVSSGFVRHLHAWSFGLLQENTSQSTLKYLSQVHIPSVSSTAELEDSGIHLFPTEKAASVSVRFLQMDGACRGAQKRLTERHPIIIHK